MQDPLLLVMRQHPHRPFSATRDSLEIAFPWGKGALWMKQYTYVQGHASQMSREERPETAPIDFNLLAAMDSRGLGSQPFPRPCTQDAQVSCL